MFDFPNSPSEGTLFAPTGGPVYVYTGGVWRMQGSGQVVTAEARNRIVNGAMQISQENGNTAGTTNGYYPTDQWGHGGDLAPATGYTYSDQRVQSYTPNGSLYRWRHTVTVGAAIGTGVATMATAIEGIRVSDYMWGTANARQMILRFGWKSPAGTYSIALRNSGTNRAYIAGFTIAAGQANTDTVQTLVIPGDTTGGWSGDFNPGIYLAICLAVGGAYAGVAGWQAGNKMGLTGQTNGLVTSAVYELFDVGLYLDPNATGVPPPWQMPDEAAELAACQRYYFKTGGMFSGYANAGANQYLSLAKPVMRATPAYAGTNLGANLFPATVGGIEDRVTWFDEYRNGSGSGPNAYFMTNFVLNARM